MRGKTGQLDKLDAMRICRHFRKVVKKAHFWGLIEATTVSITKSAMGGWVGGSGVADGGG
jgi:hypothetical protein